MRDEFEVGGVRETKRSVRELSASRRTRRGRRKRTRTSRRRRTRTSRRRRSC